MLEKKLVKLSLTVFAALVLTACGSSGDDNSTDSMVKKAENSANKVEDKAKEIGKKVEDKAKDVVNKVEAVGEKYHGGSIMLNIEDGKPANTTYSAVSSNDYGKIKVDGKEISVLKQNQYSGIYSARWTIINNEAVCCGNVLDYVQVGYTVKGNNAIAYYNGELTTLKDIPQSNKVKYATTNSAMVGLFDLDGTKEKDALRAMNFSPDLTADFDAKKLTGSIYASNKSNDKVRKEMITLQADIKGNQFNGTASLVNLEKADIERANIQSEADKNAQLNGAFYGPNAANVAGIAHNEKWGVVFAAEKQKQ